MTLHYPTLSRPRSKSRLLQVLAVTACGLVGLSEMALAYPPGVLALDSPSRCCGPRLRVAARQMK